MLFGGIAPGMPDGVPGAPEAPSSPPAPSVPAGPPASVPTSEQEPAPVSFEPPVSKAPQAAPPAAKTEPVRTGPLSGYTIVLDPGHGGRDPGALGASGRTWEKYNTWFVALDAKALLEQAGARVVLTRTGDVYLPLAERVETAQRHGASLFISIHNDWNPVASLQGVTTYYWHDHSLQLARVLQAELAARLEARDVGVLRQPFYVLRMTDMPAVLLELGFLSNGEDEARLADPAYRWRAAEAIYRGVLRYVAGA